MPQPIRTTFSAVLTAIIAQLVGWPAVQLTRDRIYLSLDPDPPHTSGDREILVIPGGERKEATGLGSGRVEMRVWRRLNLRIRTRLGLDEQGHDTAFVQGALQENGDSITLGHLALEDAVIDALCLFQPTDATGDAMTFQPIVYDDITGPIRSPIDRASGYGASSCFFDVPYIRNLDQRFQ